MADMIGLIALAALVGIVSLFVPGSDVPLMMWMFIYMMWVVCALFVWHHRSAPSKPRTWLVLALCSVVGAPIWYGVAALTALIFFNGSEPGLSKSFDLIMTLIFAPGLTFIALTGWIRALTLARISQKEQSLGT